MISIIIPTLNEQKIIASTLSNVFSQKGNYEIIVVDGGSDDDTIQIVRKFSEVIVLHCEKGRAVQMNSGARVAKGEILLFLHADTLLSKNALLAIEDQMVDCSIYSGSFFIKFDHPNYLLSLYAFFSKINHPLFTYGDQALFIRKNIFDYIKGFKAIPIMEDVEIQKRLRKCGRFLKINQPVVTSSRRFLKNGILMQQIKNIILVGLFNLGVSPEKLKRLY